MSSPESIPGARLRAARKSRRLSQDDVAKFLDIDRSLVSRYEQAAGIPLQYIAPLDKMFGGSSWRSTASVVMDKPSAGVPPTEAALRLILDQLGQIRMEMNDLMRRVESLESERKKSRTGG